MKSFHIGEKRIVCIRWGMDTFELFAKVESVDKSLGLVIGKAIICTKDGEDYFDLQGDHIPEESMLEAAFDFMKNSRVTSIDHSGEQVGQFVFAMPLTAEIDKSLGITKDWTGLVVGAHVQDEETLEKMANGEINAFSIGGVRGVDEEVEDAA